MILIDALCRNPEDNLETPEESRSLLLQSVGWDIRYRVLSTNEFVFDVSGKSILQKDASRKFLLIC